MLHQSVKYSYRFSLDLAAADCFESSGATPLTSRRLGVDAISTVPVQRRRQMFACRLAGGRRRVRKPISTAYFRRAGVQERGRERRRRPSPRPRHGRTRPARLGATRLVRVCFAHRGHIPVDPGCRNATGPGPPSGSTGANRGAMMAPRLHSSSRLWTFGLRRWNSGHSSAADDEKRRQFRDHRDLPGVVTLFVRSRQAPPKSRLPEERPVCASPIAEPTAPARCRLSQAVHALRSHASSRNLRRRG